MKLFKRNNCVLSSSFALACLISSHEVMAVGGGLPFVVDEGVVPDAIPHMLNADSLDLTYHACTDIGGPNNKRLTETGYFWNSSYQDVDSVVDSQINYFLPNGYHIYGVYTYQAGQSSAQQIPTGGTGDRLNYVVAKNNAAISLYLDRLQNTTLALNAGCQIVKANTADDRLVGGSVMVAQGEKSETDGLANGDFKVVFSDWVWGPAGDLFGPPDNANFLVFNGNLTSLGGALGVDHSPEGSGNIFWLEEFQPLPVAGND